MGIRGFFKQNWGECVSVGRDRHSRVAANVAFDVLSFAVSAQHTVPNASVLYDRLMVWLRMISARFRIVSITLFVDGKKTHNLKSAEQKRRMDRNSDVTYRQVRYVKDLAWKDIVVARLKESCGVNVSCICAEGEADAAIFQHKNIWCTAAKNIVVSSDSDVLCMFYFSDIDYFIRKQSLAAKLFSQIIVGDDVTRTMMLKYVVLHKTDYFNGIYLGQYLDRCKNIQWMDNLAKDPPDRRVAVHGMVDKLLDFLECVAMQRSSRSANEPATELHRDRVVSVTLRIIWFLYYLTLHRDIEVNEDLAQYCDIQSAKDKESATSVIVRALHTFTKADIARRVKDGILFK